MSVAVSSPPTEATTPVPWVLRPDRRPFASWLRTLAPTLFVAANAVAFLLVRPDVNDLWAARARASAVSHGVGLFYWFSWFGGGSTPGNYSVISPYLCSWFGTEVVGAVAAVLAAALITVAVRGTAHAEAAAFVGAVGVTANLWSGRVPFLLGAAIGIGAVLALLRGNRTWTVGLTLLTVLASPVAAVFIALGLSGTFLTTRTKSFRPIIAWAAGTTAVIGGLDAVIFGAPGPEPFSLWLVVEVACGLLVLLVSRPPDHVRVTIYVAVLATVVLAVVPNGLGANFARFAWFCLPVLVMALGTARRTSVVVLGVLPILLAGIGGTITDLRNAERPISSTGYYASLAHELDRISGLDNSRVEVVNHGAHAAYDALLGHASLARGWETQEDVALNGVLAQDPLNPITYKVWLDNNAVGWVALPASTVGPYPEYTLVGQHRPAYLTQYWHDEHWTLFRVRDASPIIAPPARLLRHTQSTMAVHVPCACTTHVRLRWSKFLAASWVPPASTTPAGRTVTTAQPRIDAVVADDGAGWSTITTARAGTYVLSGSARNLLH